MFQIKEVSVEEIIREVKIFQEKAPREYQNKMYIAVEEDRYLAMDYYRNELFLEDFGTREEAVRYLEGHFDLSYSINKVLNEKSNK